jgi:hypothetical protein
MLSVSRIAVSRIYVALSPAESLAVQYVRPPLREPWCLAAFTHSFPADRPETNRIQRRSISVHAERIVNRVAYGCFLGFAAA